MSSSFQALTPIKDIQPYFRKNKDGSLTFIGETLDVYIPMSFKKHGALIVGDGQVITPGIMGMIFDGKYRCGLNILASITILPSDLSQTTINGRDYQVLHLKTSDTFMVSSRVLQDQHIVYIIWTEFITSGGIPFFLSDYGDLLRIFIHVRELTGGGIGVSQSVFEGIIAHISRDPDNISVQYRTTDMVKPFELVPLKSVSRAPTGTIARLNGSYGDDGLTAALRYQVDQTQPFENILRGLSTSVLEGSTHAVL